MGQRTKPERYFIGDACICWSLGTTIDREISVRILNIYRVLKTTDTMTDLGILDVVPSYNALAIHFDPCSVSVESMTDAVDAIVEEQMREDSVSEAVSESSGTSTTIPVVYDGDDLGRVADLNGLSVEEAICLHVDGSYTVAMVGFLPHFPYLIGLDKRLETPRLDSPRTKVPAGSVGIGGEQTGIYPGESPGGWNILGRTDPGLLTSIKPGDTIIFKKVEKL